VIFRKIAQHFNPVQSNPCYLKACPTILVGNIIIDVINDRTDKKNGDETINFYEAARIAYTDGQYMRKYIDSEIADINKKFRPIWEFTYKIISGEEMKRVKVVNKDPDNLLVQWIPGGMTLSKMLKASNMI
jgi:hypothetical protein